MLHMLSLGTTIRNRRRVLKITQSDLAELAGVSLRTIIKIEGDQANPTISVVTRIADILGLRHSLIVKSPEDLNEGQDI